MSVDFWGGEVHCITKANVWEKWECTTFLTTNYRLHCMFILTFVSCICWLPVCWLLYINVLLYSEKTLNIKAKVRLEKLGNVFPQPVFLAGPPYRARQGAGEILICACIYICWKGYYMLTI